MAGIYLIENKVNGMKYIGSTKRDITQRLNEHRRGLRRGKHSNRYLVAAWKAYGDDAFEMSVLQEMSFSVGDDVELLLREAEDAAFIEHNCIAPNGYNLKTAERQKMSNDTRRKMSESKKGEKNNFYGKKHSEETLKGNSEKNKARRMEMTEEQKEAERLKVSEGVRRAKAEGKGFSGHSSETIMKMSEKRKGKPLTEKDIEGRKKAGEKMRGRTLPEEQKQKMAEARRIWWASRTEEQLTETKERMSKVKKPKLTEEQKKARGKASRESWANASPERREATRQRIISRNKGRRNEKIDESVSEENQSSSSS